ncbi:YcxB family protein [Mucilaginibacter flavidus]|uniref:YcxB family protein n=1 Tax=Mucilaginibacter flavidus TaxID=2949309 RepID=UPI002093023E|nr:YcxB family protein [Mucilaginibacter flavidus]
MNFSVTSKMTPQEYAKVMFIGLYKKPVFILCAVVGLYLLITVFLDYLGLVNYYDTKPLFEVFGGAFLVLAPTLIVIISVRQFKSNPSFQNDITYTFNDDGMVVQGITFKSVVSWPHIVKQKEIAGFLILYHTKRFGNFIDKSKLSEAQLIFIKTKTTGK